MVQQQQRRRKSRQKNQLMFLCSILCHCRPGKGSGGGGDSSDEESAEDSSRRKQLDGECGMVRVWHVGGVYMGCIMYG